MSRLNALDTHFSDGHVPLGIVLGAIGALSLVKKVLPDPTADALPVQTQDVDVRSADGDELRPVEPFLALLLGAVATHDRLVALVDRAGDPVSAGRHDAEVVVSESLDGITR